MVLCIAWCFVAYDNWFIIIIIGAMRIPSRYEIQTIFMEFFSHATMRAFGKAWGAVISLLPLMPFHLYCCK